MGFPRTCGIVSSCPIAISTRSRRRVEQWEQLHRARGERMLIYRDGQRYITIDDSRFGNFRTATFEGFERDLYVYCMETRTFDQIAKRFRATNSEQAIRDALQLFVDDRI